MGILDGKKGLIIGIANHHSIAWSCAKSMDAAGATLGGTWHSDKSRPHVEPLLDALGAEIRRPLDVQDDGQMQALFEEVAERWGGGLTSCSIPSPSRRSRICTAA